MFQEAGTWRGSDIAAAATIVASSTRRVHMFAASGLLSNRYLTARPGAALPADSPQVRRRRLASGVGEALLAGATRARRPGRAGAGRTGGRTRRAGAVAAGLALRAVRRRRARARLLEAVLRQVGAIRITRSVAAHIVLGGLLQLLVRLVLRLVGHRSVGGRAGAGARAVARGRAGAGSRGRGAGAHRARSRRRVRHRAARALERGGAAHGRGGRAAVAGAGSGGSLRRSGRRRRAGRRARLRRAGGGGLRRGR